MSTALLVTTMLGAGVAAASSVQAAPATCFGRVATMVAEPGVATRGTSGPDVIIGTTGPDEIDGRGGADRICARGGNDRIRGGTGRDRIDAGRGKDTVRGGPGADLLRGRRGRDTLVGNRGRDRLVGGGGADTCNGSAGRDTGVGCESVASLTENLADDFDGSGQLVGYTTNNAGALPEVGRDRGRYSAVVTDNSNNVTLHFNQNQGRLDAKLVEFPFDIVVRNIGIGTVAGGQAAPDPQGNPYIFAGVQVHVPDLDQRTSAHVVVGHRGSTHFTVEGKNTTNGSSSVNDAGRNIVPNGRADIRIVGNADHTLTVYWQEPNLSGAPDSWTPYRGDGRLPGSPPPFPNSVYVGLITYAFESGGLPFRGTADAIEVS